MIKTKLFSIALLLFVPQFSHAASSCGTEVGKNGQPDPRTLNTTAKLSADQYNQPNERGVLEYNELLNSVSYKEL